MGQVNSDVYNSGRRKMHEILRQNAVLGICGRKTEAVWASSQHLKDAEATLTKRAKNIGARLADANG